MMPPNAVRGYGSPDLDHDLIGAWALPGSGTEDVRRTARGSSIHAGCNVG